MKQYKKIIKGETNFIKYQKIYRIQFGQRDNNVILCHWPSDKNLHIILIMLQQIFIQQNILNSNLEDKDKNKKKEVT